MKNNFFRRFPVLAGMVVFGLSTALVQAAGLQALPGHIPAAVARLHLQSIGQLPVTNRLGLAIALPLRNRDALNNLLQQLYDPASPNYHHFLTPDQFASKFGPSEEDYQAVIAFAQAHGLAVTGTHSNRTLVDVTGSVSDIEKAFHLMLRTYKHPTEKRTFFAPDSEPSLDLAVPILHIDGLDNYVIPRPLITRRTAVPGAGNATPATGKGPNGSYIGYDFRDAYVPKVSRTGTGQSVALFELDGYYANDIFAYEALAGLPNVTLQNVVGPDGFSGPSSVDGISEVSLDIEMAISMAPGLSKVLVYQGDNNGNAKIITDLLTQIATDNLAKQISSSWLLEDNPTWDQIYIEYQAQGQSFYQASGDNGAFNWSVVGQQRTDDPNITLVGGTTLYTTGAAGSYMSETTWNWNITGGGTDASGGGISPNYSIPSWQQGVSMSANGGSTTMRNIPDVALTADNIWVIYDNGQAGIFGGTSAAAPLWAAFTALVNQQAVAAGKSTVGFINPAVYAIGNGSSYNSDFHDVKTGNNATPFSAGVSFSAVAGYDLCTGWGTPNGANLINALAPQSRYGFLTLGVNPPSGSALIASSNQTIYVTVDDNYAVTNATVTGAIPGVGTNTFVEDSTLDGIYSSTITIPATGPLTMTVGATATNEIGVTNVVYYSVIPLPANDNFTNATKVPVAGGSYVANNRYATIEPNEPNHDGDANKAASLWWAWTPTSNTNVFIDTVGSKVDNVLAVYTGNALVNLQPVTAANSDLTLYQPAQLSFNAQAYTTYYIAVASASSSSLGSLDLQITPGGQPDTSPPVVSVTSPQSGLTVYNSIISVAGTASNTGSNPSGVSQVFVSFNGHAPLTAIGTTNWTTLVALQPNLNIIQVSAVDQAGNISATATIEVNYLILPPANDFFAQAATNSYYALSGNSGIVSATNTAASKEVGEPNPAGNLGGKSLWWTFTPPASGVLTLNTTGSTFDTIMGLYTGTNVASLTTIADNDDAYSGAPGGFSYLSQAVTNGQTYFILVDGYNGASGVISLSYSFAPTNVYHLTVTNSGGGTVQLLTTNSLGGISILPSASGDFANGTPVVLTAVSDYNDQFAFWTNDAVSPNNPLTVTVNSNLNITAIFVPRVFTDGFETGDFSKLPWITNATAYPWFVQSNVADVGQYAAESYTNLPNSQSSSLILTTNFVAGIGSFDFKVSSEPNFDILSFSVDGVVLQQWSGEVGWANFTFALTSGMHTLEWTYAKDPTISMGLDAGFLDDVDLPIGIAPAQLQLQQQAGGGWSMNLVGQSGQQYVIQASTDLIHWQNISTNIASGGPINIPLPPTGTNQAQFYRAVVP